MEERTMTTINTKKTYEKPSMMVYLLKTRTSLLAESLLQLDEETDEQW